MRKRILAAALCALLLLPLAACGGGRTRSAPAAEQSAAPETRYAAPSFPLLAAPFSDAQSEAMVNHNVRRCALMVENYYYCGCALADGSRALVRFEVIDGGLYRPEVLRRDCGAEFLSLCGERLYYLGPDARPESVALDGADRRTELDAPCRSLQVTADAVYFLREDGALLVRRGAECGTLLEGCSRAFVFDGGVFYADAEGRAHLFVPETRSDCILTTSAAAGATVIGRTLYYTAPDGALCALDLTNGAERRAELALAAEAEFLWSYEEGWLARLTDGAGRQALVRADALFDAAGDFAPGAERHRCRALDGDLHTDELLDPSGATLGFALVMPDGRELRRMAADLDGR